MARNISGTLLASAARTATISSSDQTNYNGRGVRVFINVSVVPGAAPSLVPTIEVKDPVSGVYTAVLTGAAIVAVGHTVLTLFPGVTVAANLAVSNALGKIWRLTITAGNANSATYSAGYSTLV